MKTQSAGWTYAWRFVAVFALVGSSLLVPACGGSSSAGTPGIAGLPGSTGASGGAGSAADENSDGILDPLSSVVALEFIDPGNTGATTLVDFVKARVNQYARNTLPAGYEFPLANASTDTVRSLQGLSADILIKWMDPLTYSLGTPEVVSLKNDAIGTAGNQTSAETVAALTFKVTNMAGGSVTAAATGTLTVVPGSLIADGETFSLNDGSGVAQPVVFEFDKGGGVGGGNTAVPITDSMGAAQVARAALLAINGVGAGLTITASLTADVPFFGANCDYVAYFGDGWDTVPGTPPQWNGAGNSAWIWVNHEYISIGSGNNDPAPGLAPRGQPLVFAKFLVNRGVFNFDVTNPANWTTAHVDAYLREFKKQVGGSFLHILKDPASGRWTVDRSQPNKRFDATSNTLSVVTGQVLNGPDHDDAGIALATGRVVGTLANCAGGQTPWGTILTGEENYQDYYGDLEACWDSNNQFLAGFGFNPGGVIAPTFAASVSSELGLTTDPNGRHDRDLYGYVVEMDPTKASNEFYNKTVPGDGHRKIGSIGRARWEAGTFVVKTDWTLEAGKPLVIYAAEDRTGGRVFKWVSNGNVTLPLSKSAVRTMMDTGTLYVAHFQGINISDGFTMVAGGLPPSAAVPGAGKWIQLSTTNVVDDAPNAPTLGAGIKVGAALMNNTWNGIGGFPDDDNVRRALFTACNKIGVFDMNRPEDIEYNPVDKQIYFALTKHTARPALNALGVVTAALPARTDANGRIWTFKEADTANPGTSLTFSFWEVWGGTKGSGPLDVGNPDNIVIDKQGGVWFGTDGNWGLTASVGNRADAMYYLDLDPTHKAGQPGIVAASYGKAFRFIAFPSDAECTGPCLSSDMKSFFFSVQHPGEFVYSTWP